MGSFIEKKIIHICIIFVAWKMKGGKRQRRKNFFRNKSLWIYHFQNFCEDLFLWIDSYQIFCEDLKLQTFVHVKISLIKVSENRIILFLKNLSFKEIVINKTFVSFHFTWNKGMVVPCWNHGKGMGRKARFDHESRGAKYHTQHGQKSHALSWKQGH